MGRRSRYSRVRGHLVAITSALVVLVAAGCGTTSAPSAFTSLPQDTATTETTAPMTAVPVPETTVEARLFQDRDGLSWVPSRVDAI
jgi:hypothetical protein